MTSPVGRSVGDEVGAIGGPEMGRREAWLSALLVFVVALAVRLWAADLITFPRPEDTAYYVGVARNLVEGRGLTTGAIWSFGTPPLSFPRPAFEVWLPLPTFLAAVPMALLGATFASAQWSSMIVGAVVAALTWRLAADVATERGFDRGRARTLALGAGLSAAVFLPLVFHSVLPDSTMPFGALVLAACLLAARVAREPRGARLGDPRVLALGIVLGLAALTRNEAIWLALAWVLVARGIALGVSTARAGSAGSGASAESAASAARAGSTGSGAAAGTAGSTGSGAAWARLVATAAIPAILVFLPWALRDWAAFGSPLPGQALTNALSLRGTDIFAWQDVPTLQRYLDAGAGTLIGLRVDGFLHNLFNVLLFLGVPVSAIGLVALPWTGRGTALSMLVRFSILTFAATTLLFPVATTWGTFLHASAAVQVLLLIIALLGLDSFIAGIGRRRGWTRPVAWLGPALTIAAGALFTAVLLPAFGRDGETVRDRYAAMPAALAAAGVPLDTERDLVITDHPIWFAEETGVRSLALPDEPPASILDLARHFPGTRLVILAADAEGRWPAVAATDPDGLRCFEAVPLPPATTNPGAALQGLVVFRMLCP
ncbi:MAG: hypothetical protein ABIV26_07060 [Candidatus Limnocylindrales bacterium]